MSRDSVSEPYTGVTRATPSRRARAASISSSPGLVRVAANMEHLLQDLTHRTEGVELTALDRAEQPFQLWIVSHSMLEMLLCAGRRHRKHLAREIPRTPRLELAGPLEIGPVLLELLPQLGNVLAACRLGEHDRRTPRAVAVEREDRPHLVQHRLRGGVVELVDRDHVWDLHDPRLEGLHRVARARHQHEQHGVHDADHLDLALPRPDRLEEDELLARSVEHEQCLQRRLGEPAQMSARPHRTDEDAWVEEMVGEPDAVAEERAVRERAGRVDRDDADLRLLLAHVAHERG